MSKSKKLGEQLDQLIETIQKSPELIKSSTFEIIDLSLAYSHMFNPAAKLGMTSKCMHLLNKREVKHPTLPNNKEVLDRVHYFSVVAVGEDKIVKAARIIANDINFLANRGFVTGCLVPISCIRLCVESFQLPEFAVSCFVSLTPEGTKWLEKEACGSHLKDGDSGQMPNLRIT